MPGACLPTRRPPAFAPPPPQVYGSPQNTLPVRSRVCQSFLSPQVHPLSGAVTERRIAFADPGIADKYSAVGNNRQPKCCLISPVVPSRTVLWPAAARGSTQRTARHHALFSLKENAAPPRKRERARPGTRQARPPVSRGGRTSRRSPSLLHAVRVLRPRAFVHGHAHAVAGPHGHGQRPLVAFLPGLSVPPVAVAVAVGGVLVGRRPSHQGPAEVTARSGQTIWQSLLCTRHGQESVRPQPETGIAGARSASDQHPAPALHARPCLWRFRSQLRITRWQDSRYRVKGK